MVKGINRQVLEIRETGSPYFERAFFFVSPEFSDADEKKLRAAAENALNAADRVPKTRQKKRRDVLFWLTSSGVAAGVGALITALCTQ